MGTGVLWGAGWAGGAVLAAFFVSSSLVSRVAPRLARRGGARVRPDTAAPLDAKGDCRDRWQVLANGGAAAAGALTAGAALGDRPLALALVTASLAAAAADTWATSIGETSPVPPRHLLTGRVVPTGTSGGITRRGTLGAAAGALLVAATGGLASGDAGLVAAGTLLGIFGMLADSALGAALQGRFACPACGVPSEWPVHRCGTRTRHLGGLRWLNNDGVNLLATCLAALLALAWRR